MKRIFKVTVNNTNNINNMNMSHNLCIIYFSIVIRSNCICLHIVHNMGEKIIIYEIDFSVRM